MGAVTRQIWRLLGGQGVDMIINSVREGSVIKGTQRTMEEDFNDSKEIFNKISGNSDPESDYRDTAHKSNDNLDTSYKSNDKSRKSTKPKK